jgi:hypothetical protein
VNGSNEVAVWLRFSTSIGMFVGHEEGIEFRAFKLLDRFLHVREIEVDIRPPTGIAPRTGMNAGRAHEGPKMQLTARGHQSFPFWRMHVSSGCGYLAQGALLTTL